MKLLQIKWERILALTYSIFYIVKFIQHIKKYGFDFESDIAILLIFSILLFIVYILTLSLRNDLLRRSDERF